MIVISPQNLKTVGAIVNVADIVADSNGDYVLKAGTPVYGSALSEDRQTALTLSGIKARGIVYRDIYFENGEKEVNVTLIVNGMVDITYLDEDIKEKLTHEVQSQLFNIQFVNGVGRLFTNVANKTQLLSAITKGGTIVLESDITDITDRIEITKDTEIDLNGKTLQGSCGSNISLLWVTGGELTIRGKGTVKCTDGYAIYVGSVALGDKKGKVVIEGGTYSGETTVVHVICGTAEIKSGTFKLNNSMGTYGANFLLNCQDTSIGKASIEVTGGTYYDFNPAEAENNDLGAGKKTTYVKSGYKSVKDKSQNIWTVIKA